MRITRRVVAILSVGATLFLVGPPAAARAENCDGDCRERLVRVGVEGRVVQLVADGDSTCALTDAGQVYCWGAGTRPDGSGRSPLLLVGVGAFLVAGGATLLLVSRRSRPGPHPGTAPPPA